MNHIIEYFIKAKDLTGSTLSNARAKIANFAKAVATNLVNIKAGFDMVRGVVGRFVGFFTNAISEAFKFETAIANFKTLTGSIDAAKSHIEDLRKFAASTPLTLDDLSKASKLLLSFGTSVDEIMPSLKMLGDISMGDAQKFQGLALVFAQVKSAGKLMGQDLLQMINQGFNPLTIIAQKTGKSVGELKDMMSQGAISFEMVREAMEAATSAGGLFNGAMAESAKTGEGLLSTLKDNWTDAVRTFGNALTDVTKNGIQFLIEHIQKLKDDGTIEAWANKAKKAIYAVIGIVKGLSDEKTQKATVGALKDVLVGAFESAATAAGKILIKSAAVVGNVISKAVELCFDSYFRGQAAESFVFDKWVKQGKADKFGLNLDLMGNGEKAQQFKAEVAERKRLMEKNSLEYEMRHGIEQYGLDGKGGNRMERGFAYLSKLGERFGKMADEAAGGTAGTGNGGTAGGTGKKGGGSLGSLGGVSEEWVTELARLQEDVQTEYMQAAHEYEKDKTSEAMAYKLQLLQEYYEAVGNCQNKEELEELKKEREVHDKRIAFLKELEKEQTESAKKVAKEQLKADEKAAEQRLKYADEDKDAAKERMQAAQDAVSQAWGWYKDKDSLKSRIESEEQNIAARRQYEKDYKSLTHGRWSDEFAEAKELQRLGHTDKLEERMAKWRKGAFGLSVEDEATMRVALAEDEQKNAAKELAEMNANAKEAKENLEAIKAILEGGGGEE